MPTSRPIVLTDGVTPITLNPTGRVGNKSSFRSSHKANLAVQTVCDITVSQNGSSQRNIVKLTDPVDFLDADTGVTQFTDQFIGEVNMRIPSSATSAQRSAFVNRLFSAIDDSTINSVVIDGENFWS
jgi:hypothetical protein